MGIVYRQNWDTGQLAIWELQETAIELLPLLRCEDAIPFNNKQRELEWVSARILLQELIGTDFHLTKNEFGKPEVTIPDMHISLSHCRDHVAAQISSNFCGIDLEDIDERIRRISHRFLNDSELDFLGSEPSLEALYVCWCAKEAVYKWYGRKAVDFKNDMVIQAFNLQKENSCFLDFKKNGKQTLQINYRLFERHALAWI